MRTIYIDQTIEKLSKYVAARRRFLPPETMSRASKLSYEDNNQLLEDTIAIIEQQVKTIARLKKKIAGMSTLKKLITKMVKVSK